MRKTCFVVLVSAVTLVACARRGGSSTGSGGSDGSGGGTGGGAATPTAAELAAGTDAAAALGVTQSVLSLSDALFHFDPDLDPKSSASQNAGKIQKNAGAVSCAQVTVNSATSFSVDFGTGCTIGKVTASGQVGVAVSLTGSGSARSVEVDLTLTKLVVNGFDVDGTASFETSNGFKLAVTFDVDHAGTHENGSATVVGAQGSFSIDGALTLTGSSSTSLALAGVEVASGDCWPRAGSVSAASGATMTTVTFDAATATSGLATLEFPLGKGTGSTCFALPSHGSCMAETCPSP